MLGNYVEGRRRYERLFTKFISYLLRQEENERAIKIYQFLQITGERWDLTVPKIEEILRSDYTQEIEEAVREGLEYLKKEQKKWKIEKEGEEREEKERRERIREQRERDKLYPLYL